MAENRAGLFREEVIREQGRRLEGQVVLAQPLAAKVLAPMFLIATLAGFFFLTFAEFSRTENVAGYVAPSAGTSNIMPARPGVVSDVRVQVGDRVRAGDLLIRVDSGATLANGVGLESAVRAQLLAQRKEIESSLVAEQARFAQQQAQRRERMAGLNQQLEQLAALRLLASQRWEITEDRRKRFGQLLAKGVSSRDQYEAKRDEALGLQKEIRDLEMSRLGLLDERGRLRAEIEAAPREHREKKAELRMHISEVETRLREADSRSSYAIQAPVAGKIAALQVSVGSAIAPNLPVAVIMPETGTLQATLLVPTRAAGMMEPGQSVGIKYAAFPFEKFGIARAHIARMETAILGPGELSSPVPVQEPVYRVVAELDAQEVRAFGRPYPLQAGMLLNAEIQLEKRSLLEWILEPLYSLRGTAKTA